MIYLRKVLFKIVLFPIALVFFIPAYIGFVFHPEMRRFTYKLER